MGRKDAKSQDWTPGPQAENEAALVAEAELDPIQALSVRAPLVLHSIFLWMIVLAMTPFTYRLDAIKEVFYLIFGPVLFLVGLWPIFRKAIAPPHRLVVGGLLAYGLVLVVSTLASEFSWAGWGEIVFYWASVGFFIGGFAIGATALGAVGFLKVVTLLLLVVNLIGFFQYDFFNTGGSGATMVYGWLYEGRPTEPRFWQAILWTFASDASIRLMSTILNRDFYAAFCLLFFPFALVLALTSGNRWWKATGIATTVLALVSVFLAKSKGEYLAGAGELVLLLGLYTVAIQRPNLRRGHAWVWLLGAAMLLLAVMFVNLPTLTGQLKSLGYSVASRRIIFSGAWQIFQEFPVLGSGPGTFRIYFPQFRAPDYYEHEISNLTNYAHNFVLDLLSETGVLGAVAYAVFALGIAWFALRMIFRTPSRELRLMLIAGLCGLFGIYGSNLTSVSIRWPIGAVGLWTVLGFTAGLVRQAEAAAGEAVDWAAAPAAEKGRRGEYPAAPSINPWAWVAVMGACVMMFVSAFRGADTWATHRAYGRGIGPMEQLRQIVVSYMGNPATLSETERARVVEHLERVAADFRESIAYDPTHLSAYYKLGSVESLLATVDRANMLEHTEDSLRTYQQLEALAPDYAEMHYNLGIIHWRLASLARGALEEGPERFSAEERRELAEAAEEHEAKSLEAFERMGEMSTKSDVLANLASTYFQMGKHERALATFRKAHRLYPEDEDFARNYYQSAAREGDVEGQIEALQALYRMNPAQTELLYGQGGALRLALEHGLEEAFEETWAMAKARNPVDAGLYGMAAVEAAQEGDGRRAAQAALAYLKLGGRREELLRPAVEAARELEDGGLARRLAQALDEAGLGELMATAGAG